MLQRQPFSDFAAIRRAVKLPPLRERNSHDDRHACPLEAGRVGRRAARPHPGAAHRAQRRGVEVLKAPRMGEEPLAKAFDDVDRHLARMDRQGVQTSVLSLLGSFCWIESQPLEVSVPLCRTVNDGLSAICQKHPGPLRRLCRAAADRHCRRRRRTRAGARAAGHDRRADSGQRLPHRARMPKRCGRCWRSRTATARCCSSTTARGRATPSPRSPATPTTRAAATARSTCRRACPR